MAGVNDNTKDDWAIGDYLTADWANQLAKSANRASNINRGGLQYLLSLAAGNFSGTDIPDPGILFYNGDANDVVPYGVMLLNGSKSISGGICPKIKRPDVYGCQTNVLVNGKATVPSGQFGYAQFFTQPLLAQYNTADGFTPNPGEMWGPGSGSYLIRKNYGGFLVVDVFDSTNHYVEVLPQPMNTVRGKPTPSQVASGASSTLAVYTGAYGSETQPTGNPTIPNVRNDSSCTIQVKMSTIRINPDINASGNPWQWTDAYTQ